MFVFNFFTDEMLRPFESDGGEENHKLRPKEVEVSDSKVKKARKTRTSFSNEQIRKLESYFKESPYLCLEEREAVSEELGVEERSVNNWLKNRRVRAKSYEEESDVSKEMF